MTPISYPRGQQWQHLERATAALALAAVGHGAAAPAGLSGIDTVGLVACARRWARLAQRSAVDARSERLPAALRDSAGTRTRPAYLAPARARR